MADTRWDMRGEKKKAMGSNQASEISKLAPE